MPFKEVRAVDERRLLALRVLEEGWSLSSACREAGVSRPTGRKWVARAASEGVGSMLERSRRPSRSPRRTPEALAEEFLGLKGRYPGFGAKKLCALLSGGRLSVSTGNRILAGLGLRCPRGAAAEPSGRFERGSPNELWQADFKGLPRRCPYQALSVVDDHSRFLVALEAVPDQTLESVWEALWRAFGECGLPEALLSDNGPSFRAGGTWRPSSFDARLMLLGVRPAHIRPYRPQTQGKVERFHGTLQRDLGPRLAQAGIEEASRLLEGYRGFYNWERPHEALGQRPPGSAYAPSRRRRPDRLPEPEAPPGSSERRTDGQGFFSFKGRPYKLGRGMAGQRVAIAPGENDGGSAVVFAGFILGTLDDFSC